MFVCDQHNNSTLIILADLYHQAKWWMLQITKQSFNFDHSNATIQEFNLKTSRQTLNIQVKR